MQRLRSNSLRLVASGVAILLTLPIASASWLDSDYHCRVYGCVVVHDGVSFYVYDNFIFATGGTVGPGERMIPRIGNPFQGTGTVNPVVTGTLAEGLTAVPLQDQSAMLGIDTNGDGIPDRLPSDNNNNGFLDAGDSLDPFALTVSTDLVAADTSAQRSFYLSSRTDFYLTAQAYPTGAGSGLGGVSQFNNIGFSYGVTRSGVDDGMAFGDRSRRGNYYKPVGAITNIGDLLVGPTQIMEFRNTIRFKDSNDLPSQSVRFDYVYGFGDYDLSMGDGQLQYEIEFDFYNR